MRERGIRSNNVRNGFSRRINDDEAAAAPEAGPSGSASPAPVAGPSRTSGGLATIGETQVDDAGASSYNGDTPDRSRISSTAPGTPFAEEDEEMQVVASSSRSVTVTTSTTVKKVTKKKKKKDDDDYDENEAGFFDTPPAKKARYADRKPGSFAMCAECSKKVSGYLTRPLYRDQSS